MVNDTYSGYRGVWYKDMPLEEHVGHVIIIFTSQLEGMMACPHEFNYRKMEVVDIQNYGVGIVDWDFYIKFGAVYVEWDSIED